MINKLKYILLFFSLAVMFAQEVMAQSPAGNLTGAAPAEHRHKFKKKIDTSGNIHKGPKKEDIDNFENTRGPDVLADCASQGMTFTDGNLCNTLSALTVPSPNSLGAMSVASSAKMKSANSMNNSQSCLDVVYNFYNQSGTYSQAQKDQFNTCGTYCKSAIDTPENREFCSISDCLKIAKSNDEKHEIYQGYCSSILVGWLKNTSGTLHDTINEVLTSGSNSSPEVMDPIFCISAWESQGVIPENSGCCAHKKILINYFPSDSAKINLACK